MRKLLLFVFIICGCGVAPVMAAEPLKVKYGIYAGGFNVATIDVVYTFTAKDYAMTADLATAGVLGSLAPWSGDIETTGRRKGESLIPQSHVFASSWRGDKKSTSFTFAKDGSFKTYKRVEDNGETITDLTSGNADMLAGHPVDMLSALLYAMKGDSCETRVPVLDGKRRFDMAFKSQGQDALIANRYNKFEGDAEICEVEIVPVAGKWREKPRGWMNIQEQAKTKGQLPRMWFGKVRADMPAIPVRLLIKTNYGAMIMHLQDVK